MRAALLASLVHACNQVPGYHVTGVTTSDTVRLCVCELDAMVFKRRPRRPGSLALALLVLGHQSGK